MKKQGYVSLGLLVGVFVGFYMYDTFWYKDLPALNHNTIYKDIDFTLATTSPSGISAVLSISMVDDTVNMKECLDSGYNNDTNTSDVAIICAWGLDTDISFVLQDKNKNKLYIARIDFGNKIYLKKDFEYYQSLMPNLVHSLQSER